MSTNTEYPHNLAVDGIPSAEELQRLANALFAESPETGVGVSPQQYGDATAVHDRFQDATQNSAGVNSPSPQDTDLSAYFGEHLNLHETPLDVKSLDGGRLPKSVAGSGASPSALQQEKTFDIHHPQTSLPDPNFKDGKIPESVAGSGMSPSATKGNNNLSSTPNNITLGSGLKNIFQEFTSFIPSSQLPFDGNAGGHEGSFYFLSEAQHLDQFYHQAINPFDPEAKPASQRPGFVKPPFDLNLIKDDFPILKTKVNGKEIVWLDNAATTQKPRQVIDRVSYFYENENSNIHRAAHELAARATDAYEGARKKVQHFLNAASVNEIVFVRGTTEAINLVAASWGDQYLKEGDEIILSHLEHHANIVPWQLLARKKGLVLRVIPVDDDGQILLEEYGKLLNTKTKLVSFTQVSNALGTITPAVQMSAMAHSVGAKVLVDGAQSVSHMRTDVQALDADFFVFSGHKIFGPTGIGVLYGKEQLLNSMQPYQGGGNMIKDVTFEHTQFHQAPARFEAGTGNIADAVGLGAAIDYVTRLGIDLISLYEHALLHYGMTSLKTVPGLRLIGTAREKASVMSFTLEGYTNDEVGQALNKEGIAVRTGHHCAQPILRRFGVETTVRPSLAFYNTCSDVDRLVGTLHELARNRKKKNLLG